MIAALALLLGFWPFGNDHFALPKMALACAAVAWAWWQDAPLLWPTERRPWAVFAAALAMSTLLAWDPGYALFSIEHSRGLGLLEWAVCAVLLLHGANVDLWKLDRGFLWGGGLLAGGTIAQRLAGLELFAGGRAGFLQGSPVVLGEILVVLFPVAWRYPALCALLVGAAAAAKARSALVAMAVMSVYLLWRGRR